MQAKIKSSKIVKWGNSLALRLTRDIISLTSFKANSEVDMIVSDNSIFIRKKSILTENSLLEGLDHYTAHANELITVTDKEQSY